MVVIVCSTDPIVIPKSLPGSLQSENYFQNNAKLLYASLFFFTYKIFIVVHLQLSPFSPITLPCLTHPHLPHSILLPPLFCPWILHTCSLVTLPLCPVLYYMLIFTVLTFDMVVQKLWWVNCCDSSNQDSSTDLYPLPLYSLLLQC